MFVFSETGVEEMNAMLFVSFPSRPGCNPAAGMKSYDVIVLAEGVCRDTCREPDLAGSVFAYDLTSICSHVCVSCRWNTHLSIYIYIYQAVCTGDLASVVQISIASVSVSEDEGC